ncbi:hypothetical protein Trydic_g1325 [Trypoxylus dichotomus]
MINGIKKIREKGDDVVTLVMKKHCCSGEMNVMIRLLEKVICQNFDAENPNFELDSGGYSNSISDDGDDNLENDADDINNPAIALANGYITSNGLVWNLEPPAKHKITPPNIIRRAPGLPRKHISATLIYR